MITQLPESRTQASFFGLSRINAITALTLLAIIAVGAALRFHLLEVRGFGDEAASWTFASLAWGNFWKEMWRDEADMAFYYLLLSRWLVLGDSEWIIRSLSVLFGVATLPALYILGSRLFGKQAGLISAGLLAVHTFHIRYSQVARSYSLLTFLVVLSVYFFVRAVESPNQKKYWAAYLLSSVLACYSQFFPILVLAAQWLSLDASRLRRIGMTKIVIVMSIFALLTAPIGAFLLSQSRGQIGVQIDWIPPLDWSSFVGFAYFFTGDVGSALLILYLALCLFSLGRFWRSNSDSAAVNDEKWRLRLVALWLVFPLAIVFSVSFIKPLFEPRYLLMCLPALTLLAGFGITELSRFSSLWRRLSSAALVAMLALSLCGARKQYRATAVARYTVPLMTQYILDHQEPQDAIFFFPSGTYKVFNYYAHRQMEKQDKLSVPTIVFPSFEEVPTGEPIIPTKEDVEAAVRDRERVWLILHFRKSPHWSDQPGVAAMIRETLQKQFQMQEERTFPGQPKMTVALYVRTTGENLDKPRNQ